MTTERVRYAVGLLGLFLVSCGSPSTQASTVYIDKNRVPVELRDEYASFSVNCSKCHSLARAFNAHVTDTAHWDLYVARMVRTPGSSISQEEVPGILRFLYWYTESYDRHASFAKKTSEASEPNPGPEATSELETAPPQQSDSAEAAPVAAPSAAPPNEQNIPPETQSTAGEGQ